MERGSWLSRCTSLQQGCRLKRFQLGGTWSTFVQTGSLIGLMNAPTRRRSGRPAVAKGATEQMQQVMHLWSVARACSSACHHVSNYFKPIRLRWHAQSQTAVQRHDCRRCACPGARRTASCINQSARDGQTAVRTANCQQYHDTHVSTSGSQHPQHICIQLDVHEVL